MKNIIGLGILVLMLGACASRQVAQASEEMTPEAALAEKAEKKKSARRRAKIAKALNGFSDTMDQTYNKRSTNCKTTKDAYGDSYSTTCD